MTNINLNSLAKDITLREGGKISLPIGQVKEVLRLALESLSKYPDEEIIKLLNKRRR